MTTQQQGGGTDKQPPTKEMLATATWPGRKVSFRLQPLGGHRAPEDR